MYHNTVAAEGEQLREYRQKALTQEEVILKWFQYHDNGDGFTPSELHDRASFVAPLTSTRRAFTDLTLTGVLVKTSEQRMGRYGRPEGVWRLAEPIQGTLL